MSGTSFSLPAPCSVIRREDGRGSDRACPRRRPPGLADQLTRLLDRRLTAQLARYTAVGVVSTAFQLALYLVLRGTLGPLTANLVALVISNAINTATNRRLTFRVRGTRDAARHQLQGLLLFGLSLGLTSTALALLNLAEPGAGHTAELIVLVVASVVGAAARFTLLRTWVFTRHD